ncbi:SRF-like protein [Mycena indigotica]|uniref:SRF-like protein n=1 Tax=Mycena indigotica TaxID=2126181 RepID=A0A8H6VXN2_9AGAR|nr:SRF-like protein [Mycena indigotica]KAF7291954.1 SRF-like protein [Mycena indigotica]
MGRRKIEIQPITHERNRSVTFVKRKLGLMKKAYELGVLCSVEVAVIILEERPGQEQKLYQYCSGDIRDMIARHTEHDGESDTKGPSDFSGVADKTEDAIGEDEEEADEEEPPPPPPKKKAKPSKDDMEYRGSGSMAIPSPPISIRKLASTASKVKSSILASSDQHPARPTRNGSSKSTASAPPAKRPRLARSPPPKREDTSEDELPPPRRPRRERRASSLSPPPGIGGIGLTLPPPSSMATMYNYPPVPPPPLSRYGGGYGGGPLPGVGGYHNPPILELPGPGHFSGPPPPRAQRASYGSQYGVEWPIHSHPPPPPPSGQPSTGSTSGDYTASWLDYLSAVPPPSTTASGPSPGFSFEGIVGTGVTRSASTTSWERGGSKRPASAAESLSGSETGAGREDND